MGKPEVGLSEAPVCELACPLGGLDGHCVVWVGCVELCGELLSLVRIVPGVPRHLGPHIWLFTFYLSFITFLCIPASVRPSRLPCHPIVCVT